MTNDEFRKLFEKNLRECLPQLRKEILNLDDYVSREDYDELLERQKDFDELQSVNDQLKLNFETLQSEKDSLIQHEEILSDKVDDLLAEKNELQRQKDSLLTKLEDLSEKISEAEEMRRHFDNLRQENNSLQAERDRLTQGINFLGEKLSATEAMRNELKNHLEKISAECGYYRDAYADLDAAYKNYLSLDEKLRYQLAGIFGDAETVQGFLIGAANEKHINDFWDYLRYSLNENRLSADDSKVLTGLFDFCFDALNHSSREPIYLRLQTERGSRFDSLTMTRTSNSRQLGRVQSVLLEGYADRHGNIIRTSLVFVSD